MSLPLVSVIIPAHNEDKYVERCIESINEGNLYMLRRACMYISIIYLFATMSEYFYKFLTIVVY